MLRVPFLRLTTGELKQHALNFVGKFCWIGTECPISRGFREREHSRSRAEKYHFIETTGYIRLVRKLTGKDLKGVYMKDLSKLILESNNLVLVHDLNEVMFEARVVLLEKLWNEIDEALHERIPNLRKDAERSNISRESIESFLSRKRGYFHFPISILR